MRVAVIAHGLRAGGGESVGINIIKALADVRPAHTYFATIPGKQTYIAATQSLGWDIHRFHHRSYVHRAYFDAVTLPALLGRFKPDVIFGLGNILVRYRGAFQAILIHNPYLVYRNTSIPGLSHADRIINALNFTRLKQAIPNVGLVFCQTPVMADRFRNTFGYDGPIALLPNAVSRLISEPSPHEETRPIREDTSPLRLLTLTRYYPHKNLEAIVNCFSAHRRDLTNITVTLTISPDQHTNARKLLRRIEENSLQKQILNIGPVPQEDLPALYGSVDGVLLPTLLESFSGSYLEAMAFRRPILTSDLDFARGICGDSALYFDPHSPDSMYQAICRLKQSSPIRDSLIAAGLSRYRSFESAWTHHVDVAMRAIEAQASKVPR